MIENRNGSNNFNFNKTKEVLNTYDKKPLRYSTDSFVKELISKKIRIGLINNQIYEGILKELGMYDVKVAVNTEEKTLIGGKEIVRNTVKDRIFMKSAIIWVEVD